MTAHNHDLDPSCPERVIGGRVYGACMIREMPAMPSLTRWDQGLLRINADFSPVWLDPEIAFCSAQALASRDGQRRRVRKDGDVWRVEVAQP